MLTLWGLFWGAVFGGALGRDAFFSSFLGGFWGLLAGVSLQLIISAKLKKSVADAQRALAAAWEAEEARKQNSARLASQSSVNTVTQTAAQAGPQSSQPARTSAVNTVQARPANIDNEPLVARPIEPPASATAIQGIATDSGPLLNPDGTLAAQREPILENATLSRPQDATKRPGQRAAQRVLPTGPDVIEHGFVAAKNWLFGGNTVVRIGIVVLFLGLLFLAKYAVDNALVPIEIRLAAISLAAVALLVVGWRTKATRPGYGLTLQGAAVAVLYLTIFAAFKLYHLIDPTFAFAVMVAVCALSTALSLLQNSRAMAIIGFTGGFLVPLLLSTGGGSHIALFSYYTLLNIAVLVISGFKTWRVLSVISFVLGFGIASAWAQDQYQPIYYASCQLFLLTDWAIYIAIALLYANRRVATNAAAAASATTTGTGIGYVDGTLLFGMALVGFGLQAAMVRATPDLTQYASAFSALIAGGGYLALALWQAGRIRRDAAPRSALLAGESLLAIGVGFATLAIPLAFGAEVTAAAWAIEGAAIVWVGLRQKRWLARAFGLALQPVAICTFYLGVSGAAWEPARQVSQFFLNTQFMGLLLIAAGATVIAWVLRRERGEVDKVEESETEEINEPSAFQLAFLPLEQLLARIAYPYAFLIWCVALVGEINRNLLLIAFNDAYFSVDRLLVPRADQPLVSMLAILLSAALSFTLGRQLRWAAARSMATVTMPLLALFALISAIDASAGFNRIGLIIWPLALIIHIWLLRVADEKIDGKSDGKSDKNPSGKWYAICHAFMVWIVVILGGGALARLVTDADLWRTAWASVTLVMAALAVLVMLIIWSKRATVNDTAPERWPLLPYLRSYIFIAALPLVVGTYLGALALALFSNGNAAPLPYIPLLNPTEITVALTLVGGVSWVLLMRRLEIAGSLNSGLASNRIWIPYVALGFIFINTIWLRICHHFFAVPWIGDRLFESSLVQTGYAILWSTMALIMMISGHRRARRGLWMLGAALLGLTILKLGAVDVWNRGGLERVVAFIGVAVLILIIGYFAPLPANSKPDDGHDPDTQPLGENR
jgi:uncharacterized membrane protein